jgi:hypothetical protein
MGSWTVGDNSDLLAKTAAVDLGQANFDTGSALNPKVLGSIPGARTTRYQ